MTDTPDPIDAALQQAFEHFQAGRLGDAEIVLHAVLTRAPDHANAHHFLGIVALQGGRADTAVECINRAIRLRPDAPQYHVNLGNALMACGRAAEAEASYRAAAHQAPELAEAHYNLGTALAALGRLADAAASFREALRLQPDFAAAQFNLANTLRGLGRLDEAVTAYRATLALQPDMAEGHYNLGNLLVELGRLDDAEASYRVTLRLDPAFAAAHSNLGNTLIGLGRFADAAASCTTAVQLQPDFAEAHANLANALFGLERLDAAEASAETALRLKPDLAAAHHTLANILLAQGRVDAAAARYERTLALHPDHADARIGLCMAQLAAVYADEAEIDRRRAAYERELERLAADVARGALPGLADGIGSAQPFFLPYQGRDDRALQTAYGTIACCVMGERYPPRTGAAKPRSGEKIRVGIVSGFFRQHSNWKIPIKGWLTQLDRAKFQVFGYHAGAIRDGETEAARGLCDRFVQGPLKIAAWRDAIAADAPHVLIYPEVGIDPIAAQLAAQRLAPVQCTSWGQPVTSGFPTLDYYLSSDLMEPPGADAHYTERLVRLPHLSIYYEPQEDGPHGAAPRVSRAELGLRPDAVAYWSSQTLAKYLPRYDDLFPRIAREAGDCQFVFLEFPKGRHVTELFRRRLDHAFARHGLDATRHCVFLPRLSEPKFRAALGCCDAILDSVGWSGCNSTLESLGHNLPIVTWPTGLMRGRHTLAILQQMQAADTIAASADEYVALAVRLAKDRPWRDAVAAKIAANKHRLYRDRSCIAALETFLITTVTNIRN